MTFSFTEIRSQAVMEGFVQTQLTLSDGIDVNMRCFTVESPRGILVFYHGGGAHGGGGYINFCRSLADSHSLDVYLMDLRGHGLSGGRRGDSPSRNRILRDTAETLEQIGASQPGLPLYLGGHSSGAGMLMNYASSSFSGAVPVEHYFFFAPHMGFRSKTDKTDPPSGFATVQIWPYVLNSMSLGALFGHYYSVRFNYPREILEADSLMVDRNSVNMSNGITPANPGKQIGRLSGRCSIWIGEGDEAIDPGKLTAFVEKYSPGIPVTVLDGYNHLSLLTAPGDLFRF